MNYRKAKSDIFFRSKRSSHKALFEYSMPRPFVMDLLRDPYIMDSFFLSLFLISI